MIFNIIYMKVSCRSGLCFCRIATMKEKGHTENLVHETHARREVKS